METATNLSELAKFFSDEDAARGLLEEMRWNGNPTCPHCGGLAPYTLTAKPTSKKPGRKGLYKCRACRKQFTVTVGTVFEDSRIPISKWLLAIHLIGSSKKGMSAHQIHRNLGISYKAAWFMMHRLRYAMKGGPLAELMKGTVEVDETYVGARQKRGTARHGVAWFGKARLGKALLGIKGRLVNARRPFSVGFPQTTHGSIRGKPITFPAGWAWSLSSSE